jgi:hypothetical protein
MPRRPSILPENDLSVKLAHLREYTARYGVLHESQVLQLKLWPRVAYPEATKATETHVDLERRVVKFRLVIPKRKVPKGKNAEWAQRASSLIEATHFLLGTDWHVNIYINEFLSAGRARTPKAPEPKYQGTDFEAGRIVPEKPWTFPATPSSK